MAIKIQGNTIIDDNRNIINAGIATISGITINSGIISAVSGIATFYGNGSNLELPKYITVGVRSGSAVTFSISNSQFNILNRTGGNSIVDITI